MRGITIGLTFRRDFCVGFLWTALVVWPAFGLWLALTR